MTREDRLIAKNAVVKEYIDAYNRKEYLTLGYLSKKYHMKRDTISKYIKENASILEKQFFPAYEYLIAELTDLLGSGTNDLGLCYYDNGADYYELLVYSETGCDDSIGDIFNAIDSQRNKDLIICADLQEKDETILDRCSSLEWE